MHFHHELTLTSKFVISRNTCTVLSTFHIKQATDTAYYVKRKRVSWIRVNYKIQSNGITWTTIYSL